MSCESAWSGGESTGESTGESSRVAALVEHYDTAYVDGFYSVFFIVRRVSQTTPRNQTVSQPVM